MKYRISNGFIWIALLWIGVFLTSCDPESVIPDTDTPDTSNNNTDGVEEDSDYIWDTNSETLISFDGNNVNINGNGAITSDAKVTINTPGNYRLKGSWTNGQLKVKTEGVVRMIFDNVNITNGSGAPIYVSDAEKVVVILESDSKNSLVESFSGTIDSDSITACFYSKSYLSFAGTGSLDVQTQFKDGIVSKDGLVIKNGRFSISSEDDGIIGKDYLKIYNGNFEMNTGGDAFASTSESSQDKGYIQILDGTYTVTCTGDGFSAETNLTIEGGEFNVISGGGSSKTSSNSAKAFKGKSSITVSNGTIQANSADDGFHSNGSVTIQSGALQLSCATTGIQAANMITIQEGTLNISKSKEGMEAKFIAINGGNISIFSSDDSINATHGSRTESNDGSTIDINGGILTLNAYNGDPLDSNGSIEMNGGTVIIHGPVKSPEVPIDYNGTFNISKGKIIATGPSLQMAQGLSQSSAQNSIIVKFSSSNTANTLFHIQDANGNDIVTFRPLRSFALAVFSSELLTQGQNYTIYTGGSASGNEINGLFLDNNYVPGLSRKQFTVQSKVTTISI